MSTPWVPPYFGSYEELTKALLHDPFLGSGRRTLHQTHFETVELNPQPLPPGRSESALDPTPVPWRNPVIHYLGSLVSMRILAKATPDQAVSEQLTRGSESALAQFLDDYCGTPPRRIPWPWPGPPPWVAPLASELVSVANTLGAGEFSQGLIQLAGRIMQKGFAAGKAQAASA